MLSNKELEKLSQDVEKLTIEYKKQELKFSNVRVTVANLEEENSSLTKELAKAKVSLDVHKGLAWRTRETFGGAGKDCVAEFDAGLRYLKITIKKVNQLVDKINRTQLPLINEIRTELDKINYEAEKK